MNNYPVRFSTVLLVVTAALFCIPLVSSSSAVHGQTTDTWKTIKIKVAGVSILMPSGSSFKVDTFKTPDKKPALLMVRAGKAPPDGYGYAMIVTRSKQPDNRSFIEEWQIKPMLEQLIELTKSNPERFTMTRQPITCYGMKGEEITSTDSGTNSHESTFMRIRILKDTKTCVWLTAAEPKQTPENEKRMSAFFDSFTISPKYP